MSKYVSSITLLDDPMIQIQKQVETVVVSKEFEEIMHKIMHYFQIHSTNSGILSRKF